MLATQKFIPSILLIGKKYLVIFPIGLDLNIIFYRATLVYYLVVDNGAVKRIDYI